MVLLRCKRAEKELISTTCSFQIEQIVLFLLKKIFHVCRGLIFSYASMRSKGQSKTQRGCVLGEGREGVEDSYFIYHLLKKFSHLLRKSFLIAEMRGTERVVN